jgi:hypothetical protein
MGVSLQDDMAAIHPEHRQMMFAKSNRSAHPPGNQFPG